MSRSGPSIAAPPTRLTATCPCGRPPPA